MANVELAQRVPDGKAAQGAGYHETLSVSDDPQSTGANVLLDSVDENGPCMTIQQGGDELVKMSYGDVTYNGQTHQIRFRVYQVCVYDANKNPTIMKCILFGSLPF